MTVSCALAGCDNPVVRPGGGGRPKLYCSNAHRALARRRRLRGTGDQADVGRTQALEALRRAVAGVEEVLSVPSARLEAELAEARAQATAQVLEAQRQAANAFNELAAARDAFEVERSRLRAALDEAHAQSERDRSDLEELTAALDGAKAELEAELLRHHRDVEALQSELERRNG